MLYFECEIQPTHPIIVTHFKKYFTQMFQAHRTQDEAKKSQIDKLIILMTEHFKNNDIPFLTMPYFNLMLEAATDEEHIIENIFIQAKIASGKPIKLEKGTITLSQEIQALLEFYDYRFVRDEGSGCSENLENHFDHELHQWTIAKIQERLRLRADDELNGNLLFSIESLDIKKYIFDILKLALKKSNPKHTLCLTISNLDELKKGIELLIELKECDIGRINLKCETSSGLSLFITDKLSQINPSVSLYLYSKPELIAYRYCSHHHTNEPADRKITFQKLSL